MKNKTHPGERIAVSARDLPLERRVDAVILGGTTAAAAAALAAAEAGARVLLAAPRQTCWPVGAHEPA